jgi:rhodanese-related sulfurtransferase
VKHFSAREPHNLLVISLYTEHVRAIGIEHLKRMLESGETFTLLDVRSRSDYDKEHIKGARSLPLDEIESKAQAMLKPDDDIIVYCDSFVCSASTSATKILTRMGFKKVRDYKGGLREWKQVGLQTESNYQ